MPYLAGETPELNDRVQHVGGQIGTVYHIDPNRASIPGDEIVGVNFADGTSVGSSRASEYSLISRG
jgi:hypothetical protein